MTKIMYVGLKSTNPNDFYFSMEDKDYWLIILTHTPALFSVNDTLVKYPAGTIALFPPNCKTSYQACTDNYADDWIRFETTESYILKSNQFFGLPIILPDTLYCRHIFKLLAEENFYDNLYRDINIDYLMRILINKIKEASQQKDISPNYKILSQLRMHIHNTPNHPWNVRDMAKCCSFSVGHLLSLYREAFGISCMDEVINCRITLAKDHLVNSSYSIKQISKTCGYNNFEHFSRQFHKIVGISPTEYRKTHRKQTT
ncbi:MAG: AraC family transcriptional regulator [Lachnoclostridium sp.]|jgi:AraC-like DNA-binding protein|nr:AraC family transcriptional regulator [Lachnoclostridium sp.]